MSGFLLLYGMIFVVDDVVEGIAELGSGHVLRSRVMAWRRIGPKGNLPVQKQHNWAREQFYRGILKVVVGVR